MVLRFLEIAVEYRIDLITVACEDDMVEGVGLDEVGCLATG